MCGGTANTTNQPESWQDSARCVSDAVPGAGRIYRALLCTKIKKHTGVDRSTDHTELDNRFETLVVSKSQIILYLISCVVRRWNCIDLKVVVSHKCF